MSFCNNVIVRFNTIRTLSEHYQNITRFKDICYTYCCWVFFFRTLYVANYPRYMNIYKVEDNKTLTSQQVIYTIFFYAVYYL